MYLLDKNDKEHLKFFVDFGRLSFLGKELQNVSIYHYPIIILEFMTGYFTTQDLYEENKKLALEFTTDYEIMELPEELKTLKPTLTLIADKTEAKEKKLSISSSNLPTIKEENNEVQNEKKKNLKPDTKSYEAHSEEFKKLLDINIKNQIDMQNSTKSLKTLTISEPEPVKEEAPVAKNEIKEMKSGEIDFSSSKKTKLLEKKKTITNEIKSRKYQSTPYFGYISECQMIMALTNPKEIIKETDPNFGKKLEENFKEELEKHKRKLRILEMEKEI